MSPIPIIPLIIDGKDVVLPSGERQTATYQGATKSLALQAIESSAAAFVSWSKTTPEERRALLLRLAALLKERLEETKQLVQEEIHCGEIWANVVAHGSIALVEETAAQITTSLTGSIPTTQGNSYGLVLKNPLGVILGMAPWNAPCLLGLRAVIAPIAAGNVAILKGSELSPRTHYRLVSLFREAGFPSGVVNFVLHRPEDAAEIYEVMIAHPAVKKCNFTGSTQVGRIIASKAAYALKPVLLELGGKNFAAVLDDADLDMAAEHIIRGAFLNNGQICMSTDLVIASKAVSAALETKLLDILNTIKNDHRVISAAAKAKIHTLISDAQDKGAVVHSASTSTSAQDMSPTIITGLTSDMQFFHTESFGPVMGLVSVDREEDIPELVHGFAYGLSSAVFTRSHFKGLKLAESINAGAVHINSMTVHDEATLPHGGMGDSGWGRFGAGWGLEEFLQTKTVVLNP
ncbi:hypothetical protein FE257_008911 [Aspergillus nanangensis]|uniref:Aldehyde dehydrogenase domain-containing protein n=1 Tax=Aspergillus nanangensis TaxID=2582783 RepID=A0AAD4CWD4_ASPNN|nr:hypothetical protein FE257_008911 [Aspergillus nanangensis]